jgi:hypothetical protein
VAGQFSSVYGGDAFYFGRNLHAFFILTNKLGLEMIQDLCEFFLEVIQSHRKC